MQYITRHSTSCQPHTLKWSQERNVQHLHAQSYPATGYAQNWIQIKLLAVVGTFEKLHLHVAMNKPDTRIFPFSFGLSNCRFLLIRGKRKDDSNCNLCDFLDSPSKELKVKGNYTFTIMNRGSCAWQPVFAACVCSLKCASTHGMYWRCELRVPLDNHTLKLGVRTGRAVVVLKIIDVKWEEKKLYGRRHIVWHYRANNKAMCKCNTVPLQMAFLLLLCWTNYQQWGNIYYMLLTYIYPKVEHSKCNYPLIMILQRVW